MPHHAGDAPSSSQTFWAEALEAEADAAGDIGPAIHSAAAIGPPDLDTSVPAEDLDTWWPTLDLDNPYVRPAKRVRYILSPDTSEIAPEDVPDVREVGEDDEHDGNTAGAEGDAHGDGGDTVRKRKRGQEGAGESVSSAPSSPPAGYTATHLTFLPSSTSAMGSAHAYLANPEYAPTAFGDIGDYMRKKNIKVQTQNAAIAAAAQAADSGVQPIFHGLTFYINGNTTPPMEELRRMILHRGGTCVPKLVRKTEVDYVVAPVLTLRKFRELARYKVVREGWVVECCDAGRITDWRKWKLRPDEGEGSKGMDAFLRAAPAARGDVKSVPDEEDGKPQYDWAPTLLERTPARPTATTKSLLRSSPPLRTASHVGAQATVQEPKTPAIPARTPTAASRSLLHPPIPVPSIQTPSAAVAPHPVATPIAATQSLLGPTPRRGRPAPLPSQTAQPPMTPVAATQSLLRRPSSTARNAARLPSGGDNSSRRSPSKETGPPAVVAGRQPPPKETTPEAAGTTTDGEAEPAAPRRQREEQLPSSSSPAPPRSPVVPERAASVHVPEAPPVGPPAPLVASTTTDSADVPVTVSAPEAAQPEQGQPEKGKRPEGAWENYFVHKSNKQAAHLMKSDAFRARHTSERGNEAGFIDSFYQNSRLHHLSTWKTELRVLVAEARSSAVSVPTVLAPSGSERVYFHVDFDAFFVSAGLSSRPHLRGRPIVVCHSARGGRDSTSEIASASYEARAKGVRNGMSLGRARQLVGDDLETIPYEFEVYKRYSLAFYTVLLGYADELEAVSVDEALLDVTGAVSACALAPDEAGATSSDPAVQVADKIRADIQSSTGCNVSIGIAHNILLARLATRRAKPPGTGVFHLLRDEVPLFLADLDVDQLPSVGYSTRAKLADAFGDTKCGGLLAQSRGALRAALGPKTGDTLHGFLRGEDARRLEPDKERKSVSAETNYGIRFQNQDQAERYVADLGAEVAKRLRHVGARGRHLTLKLMARHPDAPVEPPKFLGHGRCETFNRSAGIGRGGAATDDPGIIGDEAVKLLRAMQLDPVELRGVGIQVTKLDVGAKKGQATLFSFAKGPQKEEGQQPGDEETSGGDEREGTSRTRGHVSRDVSREASHDSTHDPSGDSRSPEVVAVGLSRTPSPLEGEGDGRGQPPHTAHSPPSASRTLASVPSSDRVDPEFLAALPPDLRAEVEADIAARRNAKQNREGHRSDDAIAPAVAVAPAAKSALNPAAHITRQLRPKHKTQLGAQAIANLPLYTAWGRGEDRRGAGIERDDMAADTILATAAAETAEATSDSDIEVLQPAMVGAFPESELRVLGLDLDVFAALPADMQAEVVAEERARAVRLTRLRGGRAGTSVSPSGRGARKSAPRSRSTSLAPALPPHTRRADRPALPALFGARETPAVSAVLARWVRSRPSPAEQDARRVAAYLVKCVAGGMGGVDHVAALLRGMRGVLRDLDLKERIVEDKRALKSGEGGVDEGEGNERVEEDTAAWWDTWEALKAEVDVVVAERLGAPLRL